MNRFDFRRKSRQSAFGGLCTALSLVLLLSSSFLPLSTYCAPILAGLALLPLGIEFGASTAIGAYAAVSFLSFFIVPDLEAAAMFAAFYGYYPLLRKTLQKIPRRLLRGTLKAVIFNAATLAAYAALIFLFHLDALVAELQGGMGVLLLMMANILLILYDKMIGIVEMWYRLRLHRRLFGTDEMR